MRRLERRTPTIVELELGPLNDALQYLPGEYVLLQDEVCELPPRSYSVANAPRPDAAISLLVTQVAEGEVSCWVHERLRIGDQVRITGPYGSFVDDRARRGPALFLAAGSGLAPIRSLLEAELASGAKRSSTLIFSARTEADVIDRERFASWHAQHPQFRFMRTLTRAPGPPPHGRVPALLPTLYAELTDHAVFIAGAPGFVTACATAAELLGAQREHVHTEVFFVEPQPWTGEPVRAEKRT